MAEEVPLDTEFLLEELRKTKPLSVTMAEPIARRRDEHRTVQPQKIST